MVGAEVNAIMAWGLLQIGLNRAYDCYESLASQTMLSRYVAWVHSGLLAVPAMWRGSTQGCWLCLQWLSPVTSLTCL